MRRSDKQALLERLNGHEETSTEREIRILRGLLRLCSKHPEKHEPGTRIRAVWADHGTIWIQTQTLGPLRHIGWQEAERIIETGMVTVVTVGGSQGRLAARKPAHREFNGQSLRKSA